MIGVRELRRRLRHPPCGLVANRSTHVRDRSFVQAVFFTWRLPPEFSGHFDPTSDLYV